MTDGWQTYTLHLTALDATNGGDFTGASRVIFDMGQMLVKLILTT